MPVEFPATRWSLIARLPGQPEHAGVVLGLYAEAVATYLQVKLVGEPPELTQDIVQDVLMELLDRPESLARAAPGPGSRFRHWLMHLAWQAALNRLRHYRRRDRPALAVDPPAAEEDPPADLDRAWAASVVRQAFEQLAQDPAEAEALAVLRGNLLDGRGLRELAADLGLSLATASRRLAAARARLRDLIAERLRLAGELPEGEDVGAAGDHLLALLARR